MREGGDGDVMKMSCGMRVMLEGYGRTGEGGGVRKEGLGRRG